MRFGYFLSCEEFTPAELIEHRLAIGRAVAHAVRDPRHVDVAQQIQIGAPGAFSVPDPRGDRVVVVPRIDHRAHEIGVEHQAGAS